MLHDKENIMVILSSPSGVGKTTLTKSSKNIKILNFGSHTTRTQDQTKLMGWTIILFKRKI